MYKGGRYIVTSKKIVGFGNNSIKSSKFHNGLWWVLKSCVFGFLGVLCLVLYSTI